MAQLPHHIFDHGNSLIQIASHFDLKDGLQELGVIDIFDPGRSDFTPVTADANIPLALTGASHAARVALCITGDSGLPLFVGAVNTLVA